MSYTAPSGAAASVTWLGALPYTPPAGSSADATWAAAARSVAGWSTTSFGAPGAQARYEAAAGGFLALGFGAPALRSSHVALSTLPSVRFGVATTPHDLALQATGVTAGVLGRPYAQTVRRRPLNWGVQAHGTAPTAFGEVSARWALFAVAVGARVCDAGLPAAVRKQHAAGVLTAAVGGAVSRVGGMAAAWAAPRFGAATAAHPNPARGFTVSRFGAPDHAARHRVAGLGAGRRFGRPAARSAARRTYGIFAGRRFGRPSARSQP